MAYLHAVCVSFYFLEHYLQREDKCVCYSYASVTSASSFLKSWYRTSFLKSWLHRTLMWEVNYASVKTHLILSFGGVSVFSVAMWLPDLGFRQRINRNLLSLNYLCFLLLSSPLFFIQTYKISSFSVSQFVQFLLCQHHPWH